MFTSSRSSRVGLATLSAVVVALVWGGAPAAAHTDLTSSSPEEGSTVDVLDEVRLDFSSALLEIGTELALVDAAGDTHPLTPEFLSDANAVVGAVDSSAIPAGETLLNWRIVAEDGHPIEGVITFTYAPVAVPIEPDTPAEPDAVEPDVGATTDDSSVSEPVETSPVPEMTADAVPDTGEGTANEAASPWIWVVAGLAVVGVAGAAIAMARRPGEERDEPRPDDQL